MTTVVGFTFPEGHDNAAAAIVDGKLVFAGEEERFTRHKKSKDEAPLNSLVQTLRYLQRLGINPSDVDAFATNFNMGLLPIWLRNKSFMWSVDLCRRAVSLNESRGRYGDFLGWTYHGFDHTRIARFLLENAYRRIGADFPKRVKIVPVEHHLAHAAGAYYFSGFPSAAVLTIDGRGERESTVVWRVKNGEFDKLLAMTADQGSIGLLYDYVSVRLGFDEFEGPGKVMGLAPYGEKDELIASRFDEIAEVGRDGFPYIFSDKFRVNSGGNGYGWHDRMYTRIADFLSAGLELGWNPRQELTSPVTKLAWHVQDFADKLIEVTARWAKEQSGENRIALAGGVALNARANMKLHYSRMYDELFIFPAANDAGGSIGAAAYVYEHVLGEKMGHGMIDNVYLGPDYGDETVRDVIRKGKWNAEFIGSDVGIVADLLSKGQIIAWYQGRAEFGPRALGNRSIVADPTQADIWRKMNEIKGREYWRPLAPSVLDTDKELYFKNPVSHNFMILMFEMTKEGAKRAPAVCHVDMTARPQTVTGRSNKLWYTLIDSFKANKGEGIVVNTSFNLAGEPLVETPQDAMRSFALGGLDAMYLQGWLIKKRP